jgi:hypothetical protein
MYLNQLKLTPETRKTIKQTFPFVHPRCFADHVTLEFGAKSPMNLEQHYTVIAQGYIADSLSQVLVVSVNGKQTRSDGKLYHVTLSTNNVPPVISNDVLDNRLFSTILPFPLDTIPQAKRLRPFIYL